jgi:2-polyprenyl-6-methoxyphenol hydroxylase-like FAD-dependent oxidoreductase
MPRLRSFTGDFDVPGPVRIRPVDLYETGDHLRPGIVLVGDAFATACPVAGTGASKVLTDVVQLCRVHIPRWLATPGMGTDKIATFYDDPVKRRCDTDSAMRARFAKSLATDPGLAWQVRRSARFAAQRARGLVRSMRGAAADPAPLGPAPAEG